MKAKRIFLAALLTAALSVPLTAPAVLAEFPAAPKVVTTTVSTPSIDYVGLQSADGETLLPCAFASIEVVGSFAIVYSAEEDVYYLYDWQNRTFTGAYPKAYSNGSYITIVGSDGDGSRYSLLDQSGAVVTKTQWTWMGTVEGDVVWVKNEKREKNLLHIPSGELLLPEWADYSTEFSGGYAGFYYPHQNVCFIDAEGHVQKTEFKTVAPTNVPGWFAVMVVPEEKWYYSPETGTVRAKLPQDSADLSAQAESSEISDLLTEYYKERQELPFGLTEDELTCVDGVLYGRDILLLYPKERTDACFVIPDGIGYIWDFAFMGNDSLEKGVVPDSCKILGACAFRACANLAEVEFGANSELLIVDDFCFSECYALQQIRLPDSVYLIGEAAFSYTQIQRFVFPEKIVFIGDQLFWGTPVTELTFHAWSLPQYIGSEYFSIDDDDAEYRITLPFDADADRYLGNAEYVMQKKNVTVLFCEDQ